MKLNLHKQKEEAEASEARAFQTNLQQHYTHNILQRINDIACLAEYWLGGLDKSQKALLFKPCSMMDDANPAPFLRKEISVMR